LIERCGTLAHAEAPDGIGESGAADDHDRHGDGDQPEIGEAHPHDQLIGPVRGDVENAAEEAGLVGLAGHDPVDGIEEETEKEDGDPGEAELRGRLQER
jgi:hypothetical protein